MRKLIVLMAAMVLSGCATSTGEIDYGKTALVVASVVAVGMIAASDDSDSNTRSNCYWIVTANGSTQVCD